jgi:hypothetical protein
VGADDRAVTVWDAKGGRLAVRRQHEPLSGMYSFGSRKGGWGERRRGCSFFFLHSVKSESDVDS